MSEETKTDTSEQEQTNQIAAIDPFSEESWVTDPIKTEESTQTEQTKTPISNGTKTEETVIPVPTEWLKKEFEVEDPAILKAEREELKNLKANPPKAEEIKFVNDQSKQVHELLREGKTKEVTKILREQEQIDELVSLDVDKDNAAEIIKLQMKLKNKQLSPKEIEFEYKQNFELPKEPVQKATEDADDYNERVQEWKEKCEIVETKRVIAAKLAQPELTNLKAELVLPEIQKGNPQEKKEPTQEDLAAFKLEKDSFLQSAEQSINGFNGFSAQVKDKDVDYTVSYTPSQEEKTFVSNKVKEFAESGFDANALFVERWLGEDGKTINVVQMVKDLSNIYNQEKVSQKLVTDAANKRIEAYLKEKKQINVTETSQNGQFNLEKDNTNETVKLQEFFWNQS